MIRSKLGLKALGLCALIVGLMAIATSAAQAEPGATWVIKTAEPNSQLLNIPGANDLLPLVGVKSIENNTASLLFTTGGGTKVEILCTSVELVEDVKLGASGKLTLGRAIFHGCLTKLNGSLSKPCEPFSEPGGVKKPGLVESLKAEGLIVLHLTGVGTNVEPLVKITPDEGNVFAHIKLGEECSIGEEVLVAGSLFIKDCNNEFTVEKVEHLIQQHSLTSLTALGQPATIDGTALVALEGAHEGLKWAGLPSSTKP
jgi:hypothetical protein